WNLLKRAPDRVVAAVLAQPVGFRPEMPTALYDGSITGWIPELVKRRPDITKEMAEKYLTKMYRTNPDFVLTVTRDFVRHCLTPVSSLLAKCPVCRRRSTDYEGGCHAPYKPVRTTCVSAVLTGIV